MSEQRESLTSYIDKAGQTVNIGDYIVYGHTVGDSGGQLKFGKVTKIERKAHGWREGLFEYRITVQSVNDDHPTLWPPKLQERKGCLQFPERTILANAFIPQAYKDLLK